MRQTLDTAIALVLGHEGGYSNAPTDRGGPTRFGITARTLGAWRRLGRAATPAEVEALGRPEAVAIIARHYAEPVGFDRLPAGLDYAMLDYAVNSGPAQAVRSLQRVLGVVPVDGVCGPVTEAAALARPAGEAIAALVDERMRFLHRLGGPFGFPANGRGWTMRVTGRDPLGNRTDRPGVLGNALALAAGHPPVMAPSPCGKPRAAPSDIGLAATAEGRGALAAMLGAIATQVDLVKASLAPLTGSGGWIDRAFAITTMAGAALALTALAILLLARRRAILCGSG